MKHVVSLLLGLLLAATSVHGSLAQSDSSRILATIDAGDASKVHLRAQPSAQAKSLGLYFTGTKVLCDSYPTEEWTRVAIGSESGYMKSQYLKWGNEQDKIESKQPTGVVKTKSWVNFRSWPSLQAEILGKLGNGTTMIIHGETVSHWYYATIEDTVGYVKAEYVSLSDGSEDSSDGAVDLPAQNGGSSDSSPNSHRVTERIETQDSLEAHVMASDCYAVLIPTDDRFVRCEYDASQLRFSHRIERGAHILSLERASAFSASAKSTATLYLPKDFYHQIYLDVRNGEGSVAGGFQCYSMIYGTNARLSLTLAANNTFGYNIGITNCVCILGVSEAAENFSISVENIVNSSITVPTSGMPSYRSGAASYAYTKGTGATPINVTGLRNSNLEFIYVR